MIRFLDLAVPTEQNGHDFLQTLTSDKSLLGQMDNKSLLLEDKLMIDMHAVRKFLFLVDILAGDKA